MATEGTRGINHRQLLPGEIFAGATGLVPATISVTGSIIWVGGKLRKRKERRAAGKAPASKH